METAALMNAGRRLHPRDFVFYLQLATLLLGDLGIVGRQMREGISDLLLKLPMLGLEFNNVLLHRHVEMVSLIRWSQRRKSDMTIVASR